MARTITTNEAIQTARRITGRKVDNLHVVEITRAFNRDIGWEIVQKPKPYSPLGVFWQIVDREGNVKHSPFWKRRDAESFLFGLIERHAAGLEVY